MKSPFLSPRKNCKMSRKYDSDDSNHGEERRGNISGKDGVPRNINELLVRALENAANPGFGDEEPEVLEAPPHTGSSQNDFKRSNDTNEAFHQNTKQRLNEEEDAKLVEERREREERR